MFNYEYASIFQEKKTKYTKLVYTQPVYTLNRFQIKIYLESFESIYHLKIFSVKKHPKTKLQRLRKIRIGSLIHLGRWYIKLTRFKRF